MGLKKLAVFFLRWLFTYLFYTPPPISWEKCIQNTLLVLLIGGLTTKIFSYIARWLGCSLVSNNLKIALYNMSEKSAKL